MKSKKKFKNVAEMLAFLAVLRKNSEASAKRHEIEMKKYDELLKKEESAVADLDEKYNAKSKRGYGKRVR